jgi:plastocyanin
MGRRTKVTVLFTLLGLAVPAVAWADKQIEAGPPDRFTTTDITMDQGETVTFHNGDTVTHDVTATQTGSDGKPLFKSAETDGGKTSTVQGTQYLTTGHYDFICSIHPNMKGSIHVTANGTPAARPGSSQNSTSPSSSNDHVKPTEVVRVASRHVHVLRRTHKLVVRVEMSEPGHVSLRAIARPHKNGPLVTIARGTVHIESAGIKRVRLSLTPAGRAAVRRHGGLAVIVTGKAMDMAGNETTAEHGRELSS